MGIKVIGKAVTNIQNADNTLILGMDDLQQILNAVLRANLGMRLIISKTKINTMIFSRTTHHNSFLFLDGSQLKRVRRFKNLGNYVTEELHPDMEINCRIITA